MLVHSASVVIQLSMLFKGSPCDMRSIGCVSPIICRIFMFLNRSQVRYHDKCNKLLFDEAEYDSLYPIYGLEYNDPKQEDVRCSLDILNWIGMLKKKRNIDTISNDAIVQFPRAHMDEMPHHMDYENVYHTDDICGFANNAVNALRKGVQDVEKESFSSYYLTNKT